MNDLFSNPIAWSAGIVKTRLRVWLYAFLLSVLLAVSFRAAAPDRWPASLVWAVIPGGYQLMLLYALRRLNLKGTGAERGRSRSA